MGTFIATMTVLAAAVLAPETPPAGGVDLRYARPLGQVVEYRMTLAVEGEQTSLGERIPIKWRADAEFTEEVIAIARGGVLWIRVQGSPTSVRDATGALAGGAIDAWPHLQFRVTPRGEVVDVSPATGESSTSARTRALSSLAAQPTPVILPLVPVEVGAEWEWEAEGSRQKNRLTAIDGEDDARVARIESEARSPLVLREESEALGLHTYMEGTVSQRSHMDLMLARGVPARHKGEMHVQTESEVVLVLPGEDKVFAMGSDLRIAFDIRLVSIDGAPVRAP